MEPAVTNTSDPNYHIYWDFCEFTFNSSQLYVNLSYVDFVSLPIGLQLENTSGTVTTAEGLPSTGLDTVCAGLKSQTAIDGAGWSDLIVTTSSGANLRALSPNSGITMNSALFSTYFDSFVQSVWSTFSNGTDLTIDTQASWGSVEGTVVDDVLNFGSSVGSFTAPSSADIFSCSSGPFATSTAQMGAIGARLAAAFNRSTLLMTNGTIQPSEDLVAGYYTNPITNHYARLMHATYTDGKGYAFPYDDVAPDGGADQSGSLYDPNPQLLTVTVGGPSASSKTVRLRDTARAREGQRPGGRRQGVQHQRGRRDAGWMSAEDEKRLLSPSEEKEEQVHGSADVDLEKGLGRGKQALFGTGIDGNRGDQTRSSSSSLMTRSLTSLVPRAWAEGATSLLARLEANVPASTVRQVVELVARVVSLFLSMSVRALISRVSMALFLVLFYLVMPMMSSPSRAVHGVATAGVDPVTVAGFSGGGALTRLITVDAVNITSVVHAQQ